LNCHTIGGGRLTGPDLKDLSQRQEREWLVNFLMDPRGMIASGDPYAQRIYEEARNVPMPNMPGMTRELAESLLDLIEAESKLEKSQFIGRQTADKPFTDDDRLQGHKLFVGQWRLYNGGPACISCHSARELPALDKGRASTVTPALAQILPVGELPPLGGGQLGPALTSACERLKGCKTLCDWLAPAKSESKHPVFKSHPLEPDEVHALAAYVDAIAGTQPPSPAIGRMTFLLLGLVSSIALVSVFDGIWKLQSWRARRAVLGRHLETE
jgi:mono/diheme cytochrome c family protein